MANNYDGHVSKKQRIDGGSRGFEDKPSRFNPEVSPVVHIRGLPMHVTEEDIINAVQHFGRVEYVMMLPRRNQALVEFLDMKASKSCVTFASTNQMYIGGEPAYFNYSTSQKISRQNETSEGLITERGLVAANNILLFTVLNAQYPITVDVLHTICSPHGRVDKIVIFKKFHVQCMVQFDHVDSAKRAKDQLSGCDIYSGCCTLKVEFAKTTELNVRVNGTESWDYTVANSPGADMPRKNPPLLADPRYTNAPTPYTDYDDYPPEPMLSPTSMGRGGYGSQGYDQGGYEEPYNVPQGRGRGGMGRQAPAASFPPQQSYSALKNREFGRSGMMQSPRMGGGAGMYEGVYNAPVADQGMSKSGMSPQQGCVVMVYGMDNNKMNCDKLFNLLCLYGNVIRIYFLKTKEGTAMVQMGDHGAIERAMFNLGGTMIYGKKLIITQSKQAYLQDVANPHELLDGTCAFKDFMGSRNNRFSTPEMAAKNRIILPTETLHYFNAPPNITEDDLKQIFTDVDASSPIKVLQFSGKSDKSSAGLVEFEKRDDALVALVSANHVSIPNPGGRPYIFKLCFSQGSIRSQQ